MSEIVCRTCFTIIKTEDFMNFDEESKISGYVTVKDALCEILPNLVD